jgi:AcrR family transcriptional regulator
METCECIHRAAWKRFERDGLDGVSIRSVAADVGITPMAVYRHYADKEALINALTADSLEEWCTRVAAIRTPKPMRWLVNLLTAFLDFALEKPRRFEAAFVLRARNARRYPGDFLAGRSEPVNMILARVQEAQKAGILDDTPATEVAVTLWALGQGLVSLYRAGRFAGDRKDFRAIYSAIVRHSLSSFTVKEPKR